MIATFAYLILTSARNRLWQRVARLRNPRYALAMAVGLAYVWMLYLRPGAQHTGTEEIGTVATALLAPVSLLVVAWIWIAGADRSALAFTPAEVALLFTAPVSRRSLVAYRIARAQLAILTTSVVWTVVFRQGPSFASALTHVAGYWVLLSALNLNRLGVALVRANAGTHGLPGVRRGWLPALVFLAVIGAVAASLADAWPAIGAAGGASARFDITLAAMESAPARWALLPFTLLIAPLREAPGISWIAAMGPALAILAGLTAWVLRTDAAFEEAAAEASAAQAQRLEAGRTRGMAGPGAVPQVTRTIPLAGHGAPAVALLWKNAMWLLRTGQLRAILLPPAIGLVALLVFGLRSGVGAAIVGVACTVLAVAMILLGPLSMRNDLRADLLHLPVLKTYPLRGRDVVLAEVASSALPLAVMQYLLLLVALGALVLSRETRITTALGWALALGAPPLLVGLNGAMVSIHNGITLLFPGWMRLGASAGGGGIETLGLGMITIALSAFLLLLLLVLPALALTAVIATVGQDLALVALAGGPVAGIVLVAEVTLCALGLGRLLERTEPMAVQG